MRLRFTVGQEMETAELLACCECHTTRNIKGATGIRYQGRFKGRKKEEEEGNDEGFRFDVAPAFRCERCSEIKGIATYVAQSRTDAEQWQRLSSDANLWGNINRCNDNTPEGLPGIKSLFEERELQSWGMSADTGPHTPTNSPECFDTCLQTAKDGNGNQIHEAERHASRFIYRLPAGDSEGKDH